MSSVLTKGLQFMLGVLILAGITHLLSVLMMPYLASNNPAQRLASGLEANAPFQLADKTAGSPDLPFADPAMVTAVCPFDVTDAPVRLQLRTGEHFLSIVFLTNDGRINYAMTDKAALRRVIDIRILTETQLRQVEAQDPDDEPVQELRIRVKDMRGVVVVRALNPVASAAEANRALLQRMVCGSDSPA
ncbi:MAG: DUF1254 domain-containing protein [Beijerinckiaceae bacterium]